MTDEVPGEVPPEGGDEPQRILPDNPVLRSLVESFADAVWDPTPFENVVRVTRDDYLAFATAARDAGFENCVDVTAVDFFRHRRDRFEVTLNLVSHQHVLRLRVNVALPAENPSVASVVGLWPGASFGEREAYDMFGVEFEGHPDLTRILMPDDWEGYPLRKDFATGSVPVQFKESHKVT